MILKTAGESVVIVGESIWSFVSCGRQDKQKLRRTAPPLLPKNEEDTVQIKAR